MMYSAGWPTIYVEKGPGCYKKRRLFYVTARAFGDPGIATSRSSPTPFTIGVFAFRGNRTHVPGDKYMFNPFPLPIELVAQLVLAQLVVGMD
ncbi:hypothetical protein QL285_069500 [Trifolium repens]|nr:hypothetical protein QL285_069500 [Trifolium repens]